ncbi:MAG TPA: MgtC/SapB family protein [bacterium]|jgi:putative Mg2+ transporter-C (MgtC) family protein
MDLPAQEILLRLVVSLVIGIAIGIEREIHQKTAGLRTSVLICLGATIFTLGSLEFTASGGIVDASRVAAGIVTGIGFLGAGAIIQTRASVHGLTTAATIWVMASLGLAVGIGAFILAVGGAFLTILVLLPMQSIEHLLKGKKSTYRYTIETTETAPVMKKIMDALNNSPGEVKRVTMVKENGRHRIRFVYTDGDDAHPEMIDKLKATDGVIEVSAVRDN